MKWHSMKSLVHLVLYNYSVWVCPKIWFWDAFLAIFNFLRVRNQYICFFNAQMTCDHNYYVYRTWLTQLSSFGPKIAQIARIAKISSINVLLRRKSFGTLVNNKMIGHQAKFGSCGTNGLKIKAVWSWWQFESATVYLLYSKVISILCKLYIIQFPWISLYSSKHSYANCIL